MRQASGDFPLPVGPSASQQQYTSLTPVTERLERGTVAHDWIPRDTRTMNRIVRLIYLTDPVAGPAIDFYREVPFGPVILGGIKDEKLLQFYNDALNAIEIQRHLPFLAGDILVEGRLICHLLLSESKGYWKEMIVHDSDYVLVEPSPIIGEEPIIDLMVPPSYQRWAVNPDPRVVAQRKKLDPKLVQLMAAGATIPLSPENTIFVPRRASAHDVMGTSLLMRILPVIAVEWAYLQAEVTGLRRRAAPWTIAKVGIEDKWEPTPEEMMAIQDMMVAAEEDPTGAKLVFRNGVEVESTSAHHTELAKWIEQWSIFKEAKLQGLGMNEAFATGEASWSYLESMLSLGMERIRNFRQFIAVEVIREGLLAPLARLHGYYKRSKAELDHNIRTTPKHEGNLAIPTVEWSRSLQPTADRDYLDILEMLEGKGMPIPLRKWAQAGGYDLEEALDGMKGDLALRKQLADYNKKVKEISGDQDDDDGGRWGSFQLRSGQVTEAVAELPVWAGRDEFLTLRRGEVSKLAGYVEGLRVNGKKPGIREWKQIEARMKDDGINYDKIRTFRYMLARADIIDAPLPDKTVVKVRDAILRRNNGRTPDRAMMREVYWLNHEMERRDIEPERVSARVLSNTSAAPWVRPATPKLLTGEGSHIEEG
ncbi:MAG: hypothetical protein GWN58_33360 [Anaerolineae bacterium]|nr:hypothetical protein [Thermoplasmata archaeon]NIV34165.1 hypothetical protein [Anaerolineae bacterium]NIY06016.1 hypothetical protein [Thermoplasmata archaeon]